MFYGLELSVKAPRRIRTDHFGLKVEGTGFGVQTSSGSPSSGSSSIDCCLGAIGLRESLREPFGDALEIVPVLWSTLGWSLWFGE